MRCSSDSRAPESPATAFRAPASASRLLAPTPARTAATSGTSAASRRERVSSSTSGPRRFLHHVAELDSQRLLQRTLVGEAVDLLEEAAVFVWNEERRYVAVNEYAVRLIGLPRDEILGMHVGALSPDRAQGEI